MFVLIIVMISLVYSGSNILNFRDMMEDEVETKHESLISTVT